MATNNQTNIVNINNMPEAQEIFNGNLLIVQNDAGTQVIDWRNIGVLKLDASGNGTYLGGLTGGSINVSQATTSTLSSDIYASNGKVGQSVAADYYNTFEFTNGLLTSASSRIGSPEYEDIVNPRIPAITAALLSAFQANYTAYSNDFYFGFDGLETGIMLGVLPDDLSYNDFSPVDFTLAQSTGSVSLLTTFPVFYDILPGGSPNQLTVSVAVGQGNLTDKYVVKVQKFYTALG